MSLAAPLVIRVVSAVFQALVLLIIARMLSINDFGYYASCVSIGAVVGGIFGLGLANLAAHMNVEEAKTDRLLMPLASMLSVVCVAISYGGGRIILSGGAPELALAASLYSASEYVGGVYQSRMYAASIGLKADAQLLIRRLVPLCGIPISSIWLEVPLAIALSYAVAGVAMGFTIRGLFDVIVKFANVVGKVKDFWFTNLWAMIQQCDNLIIAKFLGVDVAAAYSASFRLASPSHIVTSVLLSRYIPCVTAVNGINNKIKTGKRLEYISIAYAVVLIIFSPLTVYIGPIILGDSYKAYSWAFPFPFFAAALSVVNQIKSALIFSSYGGPVVKNLTGFSVSFGLVLTLSSAFMGWPVIACLGVAIGQFVLLVLLVRRIKFMRVK